MKIYNYEDLNGKRTWDYTEGKSPADDEIVAILETDDSIDLGDVFIVNNVAYSLCSASGRNGKHSWGLADKLVKQEHFLNGNDKEDVKECFMEDEITCPYCGNQNGDSWESADSEDEEVCGNCGSTYSYERVVDVSYTSSPIKKADNIKIF